MLYCECLVFKHFIAKLSVRLFNFPLQLGRLQGDKDYTRDCAVIIWRGGVGKWAKYGSKLSRTPPPLARQKLTLVPPSPSDNIKVNPPPPPASSPIGTLIPSLRVGSLPQAQKLQKVLQTTLQRTSSLHRNHLTLRMCRPRSSYLKLLHLLEHLWQHFLVHGSELI